MKFTAKKIDLDLELVTLTGESVDIQYKGSLTSKQAGEYLKKFNAREKEELQGLSLSEKAAKIHRLNAENLADIYPEYSADWFELNLDPETTQEISVYIGQRLAGLKKSE